MLMHKISCIKLAGQFGHLLEVCLSIILHDNAYHTAEY